MAEGKGIAAKKDSGFSDWYTDVIVKSGFVDYTQVSGCMVFRPDSYFAWESVRQCIDAEFRSMGISNAYFPLFIPESLLLKEKEHIAGFRAEVAWVTEAGSSKLDERLAIRPTSETIMYDSYSKWIRSWRDLPLRLNQWNSVVRWEFKHPTPLLRSREFLWNEGHTAFATQKEADAERDAVLSAYENALRECLALPGIKGRKSDTEKFPGAVASYSIEHLMPDGKAIQGPDFHSDGQNFAKAFGISFLDKDEKKEYAYQNTFGFTTRQLGVMVAVHGDDRGLVLPPKAARIQVVIIPIFNTGNREKVLREAKGLAGKLARKFRTHLDDSDAYSPGWKFNNWELRGVPIRIEIGERDIAASKVVLVRRDTMQKSDAQMDGLDRTVSEMLDGINANLYDRALKFLADNTREASSYEQLKAIIAEKRGFVSAGWCGSADCEARVKEDTGAKITNMPFDRQQAAAALKCIYCGKGAKHVANFAKSY